MDVKTGDVRELHDGDLAGPKNRSHRRRNIRAMERMFS